MTSVGVRIEGPQEVLPGPFRVTTAAAEAVAAATAAAADLLRIKGIDPGECTVDTGQAAASFLSERLVSVDGDRFGDLSFALSGDYRTADGWVRIHANYPQHAAAACRALGVPEKRSALADGIARRPAWDVQEAVFAEGGVAAAMRTRDEWHEHPQGQAVQQLPLVDMRVIGACRSRPLPPGDRPLSGIRVLELTHVIAGPVCGRVLAAHGADVLHVSAEHRPTMPSLVVDTGFGKRSTHLDLRTDDGLSQLRDLASEADVFVQSYRPNSLAAKGFDATTLAGLRPGIVTVDLSAWGWTGPWSQRRGFDSLVQMASGIAAESGVDKPRPLPAQALDHATGWFAAAAAMQGLRRRAEAGGSWRARLALARTGRWIDELGRTSRPPEAFDPDEWLQETASDVGVVSHASVPGTIAGAPPRWSHGPRRPGADPPDWW